MSAISPNPDLDAIDRRILRELQREGRIAMVDLADRVGLSATPCLRRVKRLEDAGIIRGYAAVLDPAKLGRALRAFVEVTLGDHQEETVEAFRAAIAARDEVVAAHAVSGTMDFLLEVVATDLAAFSDFAMKALLRMPGVRDTRSYFVLAELKPPAGLPVT